jgi:hypothetical protein
MTRRPRVAGCGQRGPVIIGALGIIRKGLVPNRRLLPGHRSAVELLKVTLMSTAHSVR